MPSTYVPVVPSAIRLAVQQGDLPVVQALLDGAGGLDVNNPDGESAYEAAAATGHADDERGGKAKGEKRIDAFLPLLHECVLRENMDMVGLLLRSSSPPPPATRLAFKTCRGHITHLAAPFRAGGVTVAPGRPLGLDHNPQSVLQRRALGL